MGVPVLGLCYGAQLMSFVLGGKVERAAVREYGKTEVRVDNSSELFKDVSTNTICWMSHFDYISKTAPGFNICAHTADWDSVRWQPPITALLPQPSVRRRDYMRFSSTRRCCTQ